MPSTGAPLGRMTAIALLLFAGCADADGDDAFSDTEDERWVTEVPVPEATFTAEQAAALLQGTLEFGWPTTVDNLVYMHEINDHRESGDEGCPSVTSTGELSWNALLPCQTGEGWVYSGFSEHVSATDEKDGVFFSSWGLITDFQVARNDGETYDSAGTSRSLGSYNREADHLMVTELYQGSFQVTWAEDWYAQNVSGDLEVTVESSEQSLMKMAGGLSWDQHALLFADVTFNDPECQDHAIQGEIHMLGPEDAWYVFDFGESCAPCAAVRFYLDQDLGEACIDLDDVVEAQMDRILQPLEKALEEAGT